MHDRCWYNVGYVHVWEEEEEEWIDLGKEKDRIEEKSVLELPEVTATTDLYGDKLVVPVIEDL